MFYSFPKNVFQGLKLAPKVQDPKTTENTKIPKQETIMKKGKHIGNGARGQIGIGRWPPISTWISLPPLGINAPHCIGCLHEMQKLSLNLLPNKPLALVQELGEIDKSIDLNAFLVSALNLCSHGLISSGLCNEIWVDLCCCQLLDNV